MGKFEFSTDKFLTSEYPFEDFTVVNGLKNFLMS